jgi:hypothetical protein
MTRLRFMRLCLDMGGTLEGATRMSFINWKEAITAKQLLEEYDLKARFTAVPCLSRGTTSIVIENPEFTPLH